jgi:hypothetical protein
MKAAQKQEDNNQSDGLFGRTKLHELFNWDFPFGFLPMTSVGISVIILLLH